MIVKSRTVAAFTHSEFKPVTGFEQHDIQTRRDISSGQSGILVLKGCQTGESDFPTVPEVNMALSPDHNRVTVYRYHSDKVALFQAVILREIQQSASEILTALSNLSVAQNPVIEGFVLAVKSAR